MTGTACPVCNCTENITKDLPTKKAVAEGCQLDKNGQCPVCKKAWDLVADPQSGKVMEMKFISSKG